MVMKALWLAWVVTVLLFGHALRVAKKRIDTVCTTMEDRVGKVEHRVELFEHAITRGWVKGDDECRSQSTEKRSG